MKVFAFVLGALMIGLIAAGITLSSKPSSTPTYSSNTSTTPFTRALGTRADIYGSTWQGLELMSMLKTSPSSSRLTITAETPIGEHVEVIADLSAGKLERKHWDKTGRGQTEVWTGNVRERLQNAADGDGFNYGSGTNRGPSVSTLSGAGPTPAPRALSVDDERARLPVNSADIARAFARADQAAVERRARNGQE